MAIYTLIDGDCWIGIYIDGKLAYQDHSISAYELLTLVAHTVVEVHGKYECSLEWLGKIGCLPENLEDVQMRIKDQDIPFYDYLEEYN